MTEGLDDGSYIQKDMAGPCWLPLDDMIDVENYQNGFDLNPLSKQESKTEQFWGDMIKFDPNPQASQLEIKKEELTGDSNATDDSESMHNTSQTGSSPDDHNNCGDGYVGVDHKSKNIKKKRRLKGNDLISSIQHDPIFSQHSELLDKRLDDNSRKRMMQKIRNRISAQESRDRRKVYIEAMEAENKELMVENLGLREIISDLKTKNKNLIQKFEELSTTNEAPSLENRSEHNTSPPNEYTMEAEIITRQKLPSPGMDWKVGTLFVVCLVCASAMMPTNFQSNIKDVKQNAIMPLLTARRPVKLQDNTQALAKVQDMCKPFCAQQCRNIEEVYSKEYYETARQVHNIIPSLYGMAKGTRGNQDFAGSDGDDVSAYLNFNGDSQETPNASYNMNDTIINGKNLYRNTSTGLVQRFEEFRKPRIRTLLCSSAVEVRDDFDDNNGPAGYFKDGQLINLIIPKNKIQEISAEPSSQGERVRQNQDATGYLGLMAEIQNSQELQGSPQKINSV